MRALFWTCSLYMLCSSVIASAQPIEHLPLDLNGFEYRALLQQQPERFEEEAGELQEILTWGARNLKWIETSNAARSEEDYLQLTTPETTQGIPIDKPRRSNETIILSDYQKLLTQLPASMQSVLSGEIEVSSTLPMSDADFILWARKVDRVHQSASRWLLQKPYLDFYAARSREDIRGFYFLSKVGELRNKLRNWQNLPQETQKQWQAWLIGMCRNGYSLRDECQDKWQKTMDAEQNPTQYYEQYLAQSKKVYDGFFTLVNPRPDAEFHHPNDFVLPFRTPERSNVATWVQTNVEDEWRLDAFSLKVRFEPQADVRVVFVPGATPNVNGLGGNTITMDTNRDIQDYLERWTIRHEFGHVLGFPDCYIEFYDQAEKVMINYQIDVDNLMCSRKGKLQPIHVQELLRAYPDSAH